MFRFVNSQCSFLSALTPLQPRYAKKVADIDSLMAVIMAQAMNHGNLVMARTSDIPYHMLETTYQQYLRQASLHAANDRISNAIASLPIFPHYSFDLGVLYGAVDGQKFGVERPTEAIARAIQTVDMHAYHRLAQLPGTRIGPMGDWLFGYRSVPPGRIYLPMRIASEKGFQSTTRAPVQI